MLVSLQGFAARVVNWGACEFCHMHETGESQCLRAVIYIKNGTHGSEEKY